MRITGKIVILLKIYYPWVVIYRGLDARRVKTGSDMCLHQRNFDRRHSHHQLLITMNNNNKLPEIQEILQLEKIQKIQKYLHDLKYISKVYLLPRSTGQAAFVSPAFKQSRYG